MRNNSIFCVSRLCWRSNISNEGHFTIYTSAHSCGDNYNLDDKTQGCFCFAVWFINHVHYTTHIFWSCKLGAKQYFEHNLSFWLFCLFFFNQHMGTPGGVLGQVSDRDAPHRPSTRNATRVKKGGRNYTFCPILVKNRGRNTTFSSFLLKYRGQNTTFSSFLLKYRGRNSTNFPETRKRGVETEEHI